MENKKESVSSRHRLSHLFHLRKKPSSETLSRSVTSDFERETRDGDKLEQTAQAEKEARRKRAEQERRDEELVQGQSSPLDSRSMLTLLTLLQNGATRP